MIKDHSINNYQLTEKRLQKAKYQVIGRKMGIEAHANGLKMKDCPLDRLDPLRKGWKKGWRTANSVEREKIIKGILSPRVDVIQPRNAFQQEMLKRYRHAGQR